jgi:chromosomal replication initiation ATPase DnaA
MRLTNSETETLRDILTQHIQSNTNYADFATRLIDKMEKFRDHRSNKWIDIAAEYYGINPHDVTGGGRERPYPDSRAVAAWFMVRAGMTEQEVTKALHVHRTVMYHWTKDAWNKVHFVKAIKEIQEKLNAKTTNNNE